MVQSSSTMESSAQSKSRKLMKRRIRGQPSLKRTASPAARPAGRRLRRWQRPWPAQAARIRQEMPGMENGILPRKATRLFVASRHGLGPHGAHFNRFAQVGLVENVILLRPLLVHIGDRDFCAIIAEPEPQSPCSCKTAMTISGLRRGIMPTNQAFGVLAPPLVWVSPPPTTCAVPVLPAKSTPSM